jgi:3-oxoacyl-[acyl-carrier protein] reductase
MFIQGKTERPVALVTGATRGIGRAIAIALGRAGFAVAVTGRTMAEGEGRMESMGGAPVPGSVASTVAAIEAEGGEAMGARLDLLDRASIDSGVAAVLDHWGRIDVLVNNGIYQGPVIMQPMMEATLEDAERAVAGNFLNQFYLSRTVLKTMMAQGSGRMIFMSTLASVQPAADGGGVGLFYLAPKAAFNRIPDFINLEHGKDGISAFLIEPRFTLTDTLLAAMPNAVEAIGLGEAARDPEETARTVVWLASHADAPNHAGPEMINAPDFFAERGVKP